MRHCRLPFFDITQQVLGLLLCFVATRSLSPLPNLHQEHRHSRLTVNSKVCATSRRVFLDTSVVALVSWALVSPRTANALDDNNNNNNNGEQDDFFQDPEIQELYSNPAIPQAPEERSGLVVLRVAEVAQFQEKILRSIASGELTGVQVSPMQFLFGTQILLRNSNLDGNMKLMIAQEIPRYRRKEAIQNAVAAMNTLQEIAKFSGSIQRDFETIEMIALADMYRNVRVNLNQLYEYLPPKEKEKYYGYFVAVTEYEKKVAEGTYNPDLDGILKFD